MNEKTKRQNGTGLPDHIKATVAAISDLHAEHYRKAGRLQRMVSLTTAVLAKPRTLGVLTVAIAGWVALNLLLLVSGRHMLDEPPFPYLADAASIVALYLTTIILITQRHDDHLATRRDQLTLELAILSEQKSAKIIGMLEEMRRRESGQAHPQDGHAEVLSQSAHPREVLNALQAAHGAQDEVGSSN